VTLTETSVCRSFSLPGRRHRARLPMCRNYACKPLRKRIITARVIKDHIQSIIYKGSSQHAQKSSQQAVRNATRQRQTSNRCTVCIMHKCSSSNHSNLVTRPFQTITTLLPVLFKPSQLCYPSFSNHHNPVTCPFQTITTLLPVLFKPSQPCHPSFSSHFTHARVLAEQSMWV